MNLCSSTQLLLKMFSLKFYLSLLCICCATLAFKENMHMRSKRFLIFPRQAPTRHQFIGGIGIPADLSYESLTIGHVLKAEFYLPYNASVFRENPYFPEYKFKTQYWNATELRSMLQKPTALRWDLYEYLENRLESYGYKGRECTLKAICDANVHRFAHHFSVTAEIFQLILSPSTTLNALSDSSEDYLQAERIGKTSRACDIYECDLSLIDLVSSVLNL